MVLNNFVAARFAAEKRIPIIYRVQPESTAGGLSGQRPRLSLYPEYHTGVGLECYAQLSSPIRRYADLVLQRQLLAALAKEASAPYSADDLLRVLADAENSSAAAREIERSAKRYWILRHLEDQVLDRPLEALALRDGASAELVDYGIRGTLRGAPRLADESLIQVQVRRLDPLRRWLSLDYLGPARKVTEGIR